MYLVIGASGKPASVELLNQLFICCDD